MVALPPKEDPAEIAAGLQLRAAGLFYCFAAK
jgi:hypothetical protein